MMSNCCGAENLWETDICADCGEHAEFTETDECLTEIIKNNENN